MRKLGKSLKLNDNKGYTIAVFLALIFVSSILIGYYLISRLPPEGYTAIYVLDDQQKKAIDYPELLVINENNTFNVWVGVENHMGGRQSFEVLQKVIKDTVPSFPVDAEIKSRAETTIENGETWETRATVSINELGRYMVIFELWTYNEQAAAFEFTYNYCVLNIEVVAQI
jgi:uncharacterized membrane protein